MTNQEMQDKFRDLKAQAEKMGCIDDPEIQGLIARLDANLNENDLKILENRIGAKTRTKGPKM